MGYTVPHVELARDESGNPAIHLHRMNGDYLIRSLFLCTIATQSARAANLHVVGLLVK